MPLVAAVRDGAARLAAPLASALLASTLGTAAAAADLDLDLDLEGTPSVAVPSAHARLGVERVRFPGDGRHVALVGASYLVDVLPGSGLALGPAIYGTASGGHGGFFTIGGEAAWRRRLVGPFGVELGVYAGGGGGGGAPSGSGLMLRPHADLVWDAGPVALGVSLSHVRYSGGQIGSTQLGVVLNASNDFRFVPAERLGQPVLAGGRAGLGFDRVQLVGGVYRTLGHERLRDGERLPRDIGLLGVRAEQSWGGNGFWGLEANRAARGRVGGYAEALGTVGVETEVVRRVLTLGGRLGVGLAGGGNVSTGGGLLAKAALYGIVRVGDELGVRVEGGYAQAPYGNLRALEASAALVWALDSPDSSGRPAPPARTDFHVGVLRHDAERQDGAKRSLRAVALKVDRYVTPRFYVSGEAFGAAGGGASGYSGAVVGAGWSQPLGDRFQLGAELLAGASGGGGVESAGALLLPRAWAGVQLTPALGLRFGAGRVKTTRGSLDSTLFDLSLAWTYGVSSGG